MHSVQATYPHCTQVMGGFLHASVQMPQGVVDMLDGWGYYTDPISLTLFVLDPSSGGRRNHTREGDYVKDAAFNRMLTRIKDCPGDLERMLGQSSTHITVSEPMLRFC